jgi:spore coat protein CotF
MGRLNDKDALMDVLMQEKDILKVYGSFLPEGSTAELRSLLEGNMMSISKQQFELFQQMNSKGYYPLKGAKTQAINDVLTTYSGE